MSAAASTWSSVTTFDAGNQQQIDDFKVPIRMGHKEGSPGGNDGQQLRMSNGQRAAIRQMDPERQEVPGLMHRSQLFQSHAPILFSENMPAKLTFPAMVVMVLLRLHRR
jgi:hypothetical protein